MTTEQLAPTPGQQGADLPAPTFADVLAARNRIRPHLRATPLVRYGALDRALGTEVWVKHENHQPVGAFKVRGGVNLVAQLSEDERARGLIAASSGNHGLSIGYAARLFGVPATVCLPESANPAKVEALADLGVRIVAHGPDYDAAREHCELLARENGYRYVHSGNEPHLIAGVATETLEILEERPDIEVVVVPIGGGSGAAGACIVARAMNPAIEVIGVQTDAAPAAWLSWKEGRLVESTTSTFAEGLAVRTAFALPQRIIGELLDDFVLVPEAELRAATRLMIEATRNLVEGAGAAAMAGALHIRERLRGRRVAVVCTGGNLSTAQLRELLAS